MSDRLTNIWQRAAARSVQMRGDIVIVVLDLFISAAAFTGALVLRFDGTVPTVYWTRYKGFLPIVLGIVLIANTLGRLYGNLWKHASLYEARRLALAAVLATSSLILAQFAVHRLPISVIVLSSFLGYTAMGLVRFQSRLFSFKRHATGTDVIVIGARDAAASLVGEMQRDPTVGYRPVAIVDDDPALHGRSLLGVPVVGDIAAIREIAPTTAASLVVLGMSNPTHDIIRRSAEAAEAVNLPLKIAAGLTSTMHDGRAVRDFRDLQIEDLLGRDEVPDRRAPVDALLRGRCVLITGAGGSIGSEIARQVCASDPLKVVLVDHDETHLFDIAADLTGPVVQVLADIRNRQQMHDVFATYRPSVVFHAAAHKHVPLLEQYPAEAAATNVLGTSNVLDAAQAVDVEHFVLISTDKAVYPSSVMGASKRLCEQLLLARATRQASYRAVRFGNVLGSRGSVVPTFLRQIASGGPVTVTDERMTRYFMSIDEAVRLVLQAAALPDATSGGAVMMLDMGEPVRIYDLAQRMIRLSGRRPGTDIEIRITGVRPGEKLDEELSQVDEQRAATSHPSITRVMPQPIAAEFLERSVLSLQRFVEELNGARCGELMLRLAATTPVEPPISGT